jgi:hypothetical protein
MTGDSRQMWKELGIDLERHDALMNALPPIYKEWYLSQKNRPQGMFFRLRGRRYSRYQGARADAIGHGS